MSIGMPIHDQSMEKMLIMLHGYRQLQSLWKVGKGLGKHYRKC